MPKEYKRDVRDRAESLFIEQGLTYEEIAKRTGVSRSQIQRCPRVMEVCRAEKPLTFEKDGRLVSCWLYG